MENSHGTYDELVEMIRKMIVEIVDERIKNRVLIEKNRRLVEALRFCAEHSYSSEKKFGDVDIVKQALPEAEATNG